ncbi:MAG: ribose-phosphate pyrophosphokinase [Oscillospiraceae bacterium]|nr:ribose-phosphate pyrophosphokinase [Oscillospiraceae bacterium]
MLSNEKAPIIPVADLGIIGMRGCEDLVQKVDNYLYSWRNDTHQLTLDAAHNNSFQVEVSCPRFGSGEGKGLIRQSIRGHDLYIISDCFNHGVEYEMYGKTVPMSPDDHFQDLKRVIAAAGGKARRITVIMPMLYEGRQHRRSSRESLDCALALQELHAMGVDNIITFDAHDSRVQNAIPLIGFENVHPTYQMIKQLINTVPDIQIDADHLTIISPDEGAMSRCIYYSSVLGLDLGMFYKRRDYTTIVNGRNPIVAHEFLGDNVAGKDVIIVDDMISSGDSMLDIAVQLKKKKNVNRVFVFSTFGLFCNGLDAFDQAYADGYIEKVFTTNLIYRAPELLSREWYTEVDMSKYIAYIIDTLNYDKTMTELLNPVKRIEKFLASRKK